MPRDNGLLSVGDAAPSFTLPDAGGTPHTPVAAPGAGGKVALFFFRGIW
jgi:peroxiredoxin